MDWPTEVRIGDHVEDPPPASSRRAAPGASVSLPSADLAKGPAALGRSVLLRQGASAPQPWQGLPEIDVDPSSAPTATLDRLQHAWSEREALVIRLIGELPPDNPTLDVPFWEVGPFTELPGERLRFLVTANAVDATQMDRVTFAPLDRAVELGARPGGPADATLPDGTSVWLDGGPLEPFAPEVLEGHPIVPRPHLVAGRLRVAANAGPPWADLAPDQLAAVDHRRGPARIIAPAGSGKTRVLTERTRHLASGRGVDPATIALVAYNRRARQEMADRLTDVRGLDIRTLNSLALAIVNRSGPRTTIDERDVRRRLERLVPVARRRANTDPLEAWVDALSACRLGLRSPASIEDEYPDVTEFATVLGRYRDELARRRELDFDEQILAAVEILLRDPDARADARAGCPVLLVDEFQDLTPAHLLLVRLLAGPANEVFAVGDDDQTIYGYSGASPEWLVDFGSAFPGAVDHPLTVNYRCPPGVVTAATNLLSHNRVRVAKQIHPAPDRLPVDGEFRIDRTAHVHSDLVAHVQELLADGAAPNEVAVLARVNAALLAPLLYLRAAGIPAGRPPGVDARLIERSGTGAALAWLRLAAAPDHGFSGEDLRLALRRPTRSLHPRIADWVAEQRSVADLVALSGRLNQQREQDAVAGFASDIARLRRAAASGARAAPLLDIVNHEIGLLGAASQLDRSQRTVRRAAHSDELAALTAVAALHDDPQTLGPWLAAQLAAPDPPADQSLTVATIHSTKGLEWPHVVVHDVRADLHPHQLAVDIEEERRVLHVAITRGRKSVRILASEPASPFLPQLEQARDPNIPDSVIRSARVTATSPVVSTRPSVQDSDPLKAALKKWRFERARADRAPAYTVFTDATLEEIAGRRPRSLSELGRVKGIGPAKLDRFGDEVLGIVASLS